MSFDPEVDGHVIWAYWHLAAANAVTPEQRAALVQWVNNQKEVFPCLNCRNNLNRHLSENPIEPYSHTNVSLLYHSWKMHDTVNRMLNKPLSQRLTYEQLFEKFFPGEQPHMGMRSQKQIPMNLAPGTQEAPPHGGCPTCGGQKTQNSAPTFNEHRKLEKRRFVSKNT